MNQKLPRRSFIKLGLGATAMSMLSEPAFSYAAKGLPRWRGFNLLEKFNGDHNQPFVEKDFQMIKEWGFDFVRLPMSYHCWAKPDDWMKLNEAVLKEIDQAVAFGNKYKIHVNLNLHRIPGYCVNPPAEPANLWKDAKALEAAVFHWKTFAKRYKGISNKKVSFDLINEPAGVSNEDYVKVITSIIDGIRDVDPDRLIVVDGLQWGTKPVLDIQRKNIGQSTRGYAPMEISHYKASWTNIKNQPIPSWPLVLSDNNVWNKDRLRKDIFEPWKKLADEGTGVHVGEWGAYQHTPHEVALSWMKDNLEIWKEYGWGWALWNFRGSFGILDSGRSDVAYEDYKGHKLDRKMLDLLLKY
jgi:endoglucanase